MTRAHGPTASEAPAPDEDPSAETATPDRGGALMLRWRDRGDAEAFDELVELYAPRAHALVTRFLGRSCRNAEDLVQEVFVRIVRARDRYEPTARFSTWLYSIVFRLCVNQTQRSRDSYQVSIDAGDEGPLALVDAAAPDPSAGLERGDAVSAVRHAIAALPENQRIAVVLARYHGLAYAEIAEVVGSSPKAIKSLIHRARETLRDQLRPFMEAGDPDGVVDGDR